LHTKTGKNQKEIAEQLGVRSADITLIFKHKEYLETGKETISMPKLQKLNEALNVKQNH